ncbi:hypothetical protein SAMN06265355_102641 [Actinomadura mexicana]|uniref:Uncharacterized protein n=1 Tax=Actinomadura mexicana TaxID=134959 RepID=A0A238W2H7_9ACTN|nr:hypothetical protein SAMN06265355_102641 [Actinomadura mexicana]
MANAHTGTPLMGAPDCSLSTGRSTVASVTIGTLPLFPGTGGSAVAFVTTEAPPIVQACDRPGHVQVTCMFCQVSYCSLCDGHSC